MVILMAIYLNLFRMSQTDIRYALRQRGYGQSRRITAAAPVYIQRDHADGI